MPYAVADRIFPPFLCIIALTYRTESGRYAGSDSWIRQDSEKQGGALAMSVFKQDIRFTHSADGTRLAYASFGEGYP
ncbi:MAG: hypothetical protein ACKVQU_34865, partial [Burkholderiales bacterium]